MAADALALGLRTLIKALGGFPQTLWINMGKTLGNRPSDRSVKAFETNRSKFGQIDYPFDNNKLDNSLVFYYGKTTNQ